MSRLKIYISGPMTGLPDLNRRAFYEMSHRVAAAGHVAVNPAELCSNPDLTWEQCMRTDIKALCDCDALLLIPGWEHSRGAHLELHIAHRIGISVGIYRDAGELLTWLRTTLDAKATATPPSAAALAELPEPPSVERRGAMSKRIELGDRLFSFKSFEEWRTKGSRIWNSHGVQVGETICIDQKGRLCRSSVHFIDAHFDQAYPIDVHLVRNDLRFEVTE